MHDSLFRISLAVMSLAVSGAAPASDIEAAETMPPADQAVVYFDAFCLETAGDFRQSIARFSESEAFELQSMVERGGYTYAGFVHSLHVSASVSIGSDYISDQCKTILFGVKDPMYASELIANYFGKKMGKEVVLREAFSDYGKGGYTVSYGHGDIVVAPLTKGISSDIIHISYRLTIKD